MILFLYWALTRLDECGVAQRVCVCRGPPESWLLESCFPPAEYIMSPLTGVWRLIPASQLKSNTGKPARYERTSQLAAQPLLKPSLTTSTLPLAQSLQTQTNHVEGKKGKQGVCFCKAPVVTFISPGCLHTHHTTSSMVGTAVVGVCKDNLRCRSSTADADAPRCSYAFIAVLQEICFSSLV